MIQVESLLETGNAGNRLASGVDAVRAIGEGTRSDGSDGLTGNQPAWLEHHDCK